MAAVVIRHIRDPLWTKPALSTPGGQLAVALDLLEQDLEALTVTLIGSVTDHPLAVNAQGTVHDGRYQELQLELAPDLAAGLYGLRLDWPGGRETMPKCVWVHEPGEQPCRFVHLADPHVAAVDERPGWGLRRAVEQINLLAPDFVLLTGDLIARYTRPNKTTLTGATVEADMLAAQRLMLQLEAPLFLTAGNHDLGFDWCRDTYRRYMSRPLVGPTQDYGFTYRDVRFSTFEAYRLAGPSLAPLPPSGPTPLQRAWLHKELAGAQAAAARVLFYHYDYDQLLPPFFDRYAVNLALFGHTKPWGVEEVGETPTVCILDRPARHSAHFRLIAWDGRSFDVSRAIDADIVPAGRALEARWLLPNDGTVDRNQLRVINRSDYAFAGLEARFRVRPGAYRVEGGKAVQVVEGERGSLYRVRYDLAPGERRVVKLAPG